MAFNCTAAICTKPVQVITALCMRDARNNLILIIVAEFKDSDLFAARLAESNLVSQVYLAADRNAAVRIANKLALGNVLIDSDVGVRNFIRVARLRLFGSRPRVYVFEEGIGTYRADIYPARVKFWFELLGVGAVFGGCLLVNGVLVHDKKRYDSLFPNLAAKSAQIAMGHDEFISANVELVGSLFGFSNKELLSFSGLNIVLFLTNWEVDYNRIGGIDLAGRRLLLKPHPHVREHIITQRLPAGAVVLDGGVPAEFLLIILSELAASVTVFHYGSSTVSNIVRANISEVKLS